MSISCCDSRVQREYRYGRKLEIKRGLSIFMDDEGSERKEVGRGREAGNEKKGSG